jgi:hypothetical protein
MKCVRFVAFALVIILAFSVPVFAAGQLANPFSLYRDDTQADSFYDMYLNEGGVCTILNKAVLTQAIDALPKLAEAKTLSQEKLVKRIIKVERFNKYAKHIYELRPGELRFDEKGYVLSKTQYEGLLASINKSLEETAVHSSISYPFWLTWMNPERVTKINYIDKTGQTAQSHTALQENLYFTAPSLQWENVKRASQRYDLKTTEIAKLSGGIYTTIEFDSGAIYRVFINADNLYVEYSGADYGYKYINVSESALSAYKSSMREAYTKRPSNLPGYTG